MWLYDRPIAHRGLHDKELTENSMAAFEKAIEFGYNIETDVHLLKSGEVVIFHDNTLKRVCGKNAKISDLTLDDIKGENYLLPNGEHIPLLSEFLELAEDKTGILLELKINGFNYLLEEAVYELIKGKESIIAVQSFNPWTVAWFAENAPEFLRGLLSYNYIFPLGKLMRKRVKSHFLAFDIKSLTPAIAQYATKNKLNLLTWTVRTPELLDKAIDIGVNNIIYEKIDLDGLGFTMSKLAPVAF